MAGAEMERVALARVQLAAGEKAPVLAGAHVVGQAAVERRRVEPGGDRVAGEGHPALLDQDLGPHAATLGPHRALTRRIGEQGLDQPVDVVALRLDRDLEPRLARGGAGDRADRDDAGLGGGAVGEGLAEGVGRIETMRAGGGKRSPRASTRLPTVEAEVKVT